MKKNNLIRGLVGVRPFSLTLGLAIIGMMAIPANVSAFSLRELLGGQATPANNAQPEQVLSATTEEASTDTATEAVEAENPIETKPNEVLVEVVKGDSLSKIAKAHDTTYERIFYANDSIADPNVILPGQKIRIPEASEKLTARPLPSPKPVVKPTAKVVEKPVKQPARATTKSSRTAPATPAPAVANGSVWDQLARCESGGNWSINTGNGYYGGLQFTASTWRAVGGSGLPHQNSREEQIHRAEILLARSGWGQWPACTKKLGLR